MGSMRNPKDLMAGLIFLGFGATFLWIGKDYTMGTARQMGPGYFPILLSALLLLLGLALCIRALLTDGEPVKGFNWTGIAIITVATILFGFLIRPAGLAIAIFTVVLVGATASKQFRLGPMVLLALGMSVFCVAVFIKGLGLPILLFGSWFG